MAGALACPWPLAAQSDPDPAATIEQMRARDRLAAPGPELAAWQAFADPLLADAATPAALRAELLHSRAIARYYTQDYAGALEDWQAAQTIALALPASPPFMAELQAYGAAILTELGRHDEAAVLAADALARAESEGTAAFREQALAHNVLAGVAFARNDLAGAEREFCTARDLGLAAPVQDAPMVVNDASSCGVVKFFLERPDTLDAMRLASSYAYAHLPSDHPRMGNVLNSSYGVLLRYGRYAEAEPLIRRHLDLERSLRTGEADEIYDPLSMLARAQELRGNFEEAEGLFRAAADMADRLRNRSQPYKRGIARANLARVLARQGRIAEAIEQSREGVLRLREDLEPGDSNIGSGQVQLADNLARAGQYDEALQQVDEGLALLAAAYPPGHSEVIAGRLVRARVLSGLGRDDEALDESRGATSAFEAQMGDLAASETDRIALSRVLPNAFSDHVAVALAAGSMEDAVHGAQLWLLSELALTNARIAAATLAREEGLGAAVDRLQAADAAVAEAETAFAAAQGRGDDTLAALSQQLSQARDAAREAQAALVASFPQYAALTRPHVPTLAEVQERLGAGEALVLPLSLPDRAVTLLVTRDSVDWAETAITPLALGKLVDRVQRGASEPGAFDPVDARRLYDVVFPEGLRPRLERAGELLFPASGYLARLSPAVLLAGPASLDDLAHAPWLVRSHAIRVLADFTALGPAEGAVAAREFLGVGAPDELPAVFSGSPLRSAEGGALPPLPRARSELEQMADALGSARPLVLAGAEATEARLASLDLDRFGVIAFATHGLVGGDLPGLDEPALLLSGTDPARKEADGLLTASEIAALRLSADWVILSACETAAGERVGAPSYSGLARAFAAAGARGLMLSHWRVRDDAAALLSVATLRGAAQGLSRGEALRAAQLDLMARTDVPQAAEPAVWAPFVILQNQAD